VVKAGADELIERLKSEGKESPADLLITVDAGRLHRASEAGLLRSLAESGGESVLQRVPKHLQDEDAQWVALTKRVRAIIYSLDRVEKEQLSSYADLAEEKWKGKILIRSSGNIYNQSLLASIIAHQGDATAKDWAAAIKANMTRPPQGGDRDQIRGVAQGLADVAVANTYYLGQMVNSSEKKDQDLAAKVGVFYPNQNDRGAHINVSAAGLCLHAKNTENAMLLLTFLLSDQAQQQYAQSSYEFPVVEGLSSSALLNSWGEFKSDQLPLSALGENNQRAVEIFGEVSWQ